jgi:hypothetical protein
MDALYWIHLPTFFKKSVGREGEGMVVIVIVDQEVPRR